MNDHAKINGMTFDPGTVRLDSINWNKPRWWQFWRWFERQYRVEYRFTILPETITLSGKLNEEI